MSNDTSPQPLLQRAYLWRWLAQAFWYPGGAAQPDEGLTWREVEELTAAVDCTGELTPALRRLRLAQRMLVDSGIGLVEEHTHLFARQVLCPLHESSYAAALAAEPAGPGHGTGLQATAELGGLYAAFGFQAGPRRPELPDHLCLELEFLAVLLAKEAYARSQDWDEALAACQQARRILVRGHLQRWLPALRERLVQHARLPFYPALVELVLAVLEQEETELAELPA